MKREQFDSLNLPDLPGVYRFLKGKDVLYIGKATSLRDRVKSYFSRDLIRTRGPLLVKMVEESNAIEWETTDSVLEALILEANTIKRYRPAYNSKEKDDKSYNFIVVTKEDFPVVRLARGREILHGIDGKGKSIAEFRSVFGPYPNGSQLKEALKIVRKIFPFRDTCTPKGEKKHGTGKPCFNRQIGLCPGVCTGEISSKDYKKTIRNIELFFDAKKEKIRSNLQKEMKSLASRREFEKADSVKKQLFALDHIRDVSLLSKERIYTGESEYRIESYDIAHISGVDTVGVMVVVSNGEPDTNEYRKFKIRGGNIGVQINDIQNLEEILIRRLAHHEWKLPNLIVVDGGTAQKNIAETVIEKKGYSIPVVAVVKDASHKPKDILGMRGLLSGKKDAILLANSEAHRFAKGYHTQLRRKPYRRTK